MHRDSGPGQNCSRKRMAELPQKMLALVDVGSLPSTRLKPCNEFFPSVIGQARRDPECCQLGMPHGHVIIRM